MTEMRWKNRPDGSTWGDWGADDQLGRLNLVTPDVVRRGIASVEQGITFALSLPLDIPGKPVLNPVRFPPILRPTRRNPTTVNFSVQLGALDEGRTDVISDDLAIIHLQYSTQWDSFAHIGSMFDADGDGVPEPVYYNGFRAGIDIVGPSNVEDSAFTADMPPVSTSYAHALSIRNMAEMGLQSSGVMIDLVKHFGSERRVIGMREIQQILDADRIEILPGDIVCFHTGFAEVLLEMGADTDAEKLAMIGPALDGSDQDLHDWITRTQMTAIVADNFAVENYPSPLTVESPALMPLHEHCLFRLGVSLGELWRLTPLANWLEVEGRSRFLLTAPPLNLPGAVGSPVTPVATV